MSRERIIINLETPAADLTRYQRVASPSPCAAVVRAAQGTEQGTLQTILTGLCWWAQTKAPRVPIVRV